MVRPFGRSQPNLDLDLTALEGHESKRSTFVVLAESLSRRPSWFRRSKFPHVLSIPTAKYSGRCSICTLFCRPYGAHGMK